MKDLENICLVGDDLLSSSFDDTQAITEEYEREWFHRNQKVGFRWSPVRKEAHLLHKQLSDEISDLRGRLTLSLYITLANVALTCALAWLIGRS